MRKAILVLMILVALVTTISAQSTTANSAKGMALNGSTGIVVVPTARIGWEYSDFGLNFGYSFLWNGGSSFEHVPRVNLSIARKLEVSGVFHFDNNNTNAFENAILGVKFQAVRDGGAALAIGGDFEITNGQRYSGNSSKVYLAATYSGEFFSLPAVTTATIGWQFLETGSFSSQLIYGMGFEMSLFPSTFRNIVYWITDFANFSYAVRGGGINLDRGAFNTGLRIAPLQEGRFYMVIDVIGTDLLDNGGRGLVAGVSGGFAL